MLSHTTSWSESTLKGEGDSLPAECISFFHGQIVFLPLFPSLSNYCFPLSNCHPNVFSFLSFTYSYSICCCAFLIFFYYSWWKRKGNAYMICLFLCAIEMYLWEKEQLVHADQYELLLKWAYFIGSFFFNEQLLIQSSLTFGGWMVRNIACSKYVNIDTNRYTKYITSILYLYVLSW